MDGVKSAEAVEAVAKAQEAVEASRHNQITEIVEGAVKPLREEQARVREVLESSQTKMQNTIDTLATKEDIREIKTFMENVDLTFKVIRGTGRWGKTAILTIAGLFIAFGIITGGIKGFIAAIAGWAIGKP